MTAVTERPSAVRGADGPVRVEGVEKVTGTARYAYEGPADDVAYAVAVTSTVAAGRVTSVGVAAAEAVDGVLAVLWHGNAPTLGDGGDPVLAVLQDDAVHHRGQVVALVVATSSEVARQVAAVLDVGYDARGHDAVLTVDHPTLYAPAHVNPAFETDAETGDPDGALERAAVAVDQTYRTPPLHNQPMEPHATTARWEGDRLEVHDSSQGSGAVQVTLSKLFGVPRTSVHVVSDHVGGGFGSKGTPRPGVVLATMAARVTGRAVRIALTRQQLFTVVGYRTPTIQRVRLGADADGHLQAITHDVVEQTATVKEFAEQTAVATRMMYAAPHRRTTHRLARLDVPVPSWMRAPGECPGMFALESAVDELALAVGVDPIELRVLNEPERDPERDLPWSSRNLVACLREGARRFGWETRGSERRGRRDGRWLVGTGVAASVYPTYEGPASASARATADGRFVVSVNATDIGTGARTALLVLAAEALDVDASRVEVRIGDSDLPQAGIAGGSMGTRSWGWAVTKACRGLVEEISGLPEVPADGVEVSASTKEDIAALAETSRHAFGAQFVEVRVDVDSGEVRVPRMTGVFAAGRIVNPRTARSQLLGGMTMGLSMALHEEGIVDAVHGDFVNHDLASYHVASNADVGDVDVSWVEERDTAIGGTGSKGIGEIGIVGTAAAVANAVFDATGVRVRELPIRIEDLLPALP